MNLPEMMTYTSRLINDPNDKNFSQSVKYVAIRQAYWQVFNKIRSLKERYSVTWLDINSTDDFTDIGGNVKSFEIPPQYIGIERFERLGDTNNDQPVGIFPIDFGEKNKYFNSAETLIFDFSHTKFYLIGHRLSVNADAPDQDFRLYVIRRWPELSSGTFAAGGSTTTCILPPSPTIGSTIIDDDYYNDSIIQVVDVGSGNLRAIRRVSDYVASTRTITVSSSFGFTPAISDTYSFIPEFDESHHELVAFKAAIRLMIGRGNAAHIANLKQEAFDIEEEMKKSQKVRQDAEPRAVKDEEDAYV